MEINTFPITSLIPKLLDWKVEKKYSYFFSETGLDPEEMETGWVMCNFIIWSAFPVVVVFEAIFVRLVNNSKMSEENFLVDIYFHSTQTNKAST